MEVSERLIVDDVPPTSGMSLDDLIREFSLVDRQAKEAFARKRELASALADIAWEGRGERNTVHLTAESGQKLKVEFRSDFEYDPEQLLTVSGMIGKDAFDDLFKTEIKFTAKRRNLNAFLSTVYTDELKNTAKEIIRDAVRETQSQPYVSVEKK